MRPEVMGSPKLIAQLYVSAILVFPTIRMVKGVPRMMHGAVAPSTTIGDAGDRMPPPCGSSTFCRRHPSTWHHKMYYMWPL